MSALPQELPKRVVHRVRVGIRDGRIVRIKYCRQCECDKIVSDVPSESEFPITTRNERRTLWKPVCKKCFAKNAKDRRDRDVNATRRVAHETYVRIRTDPERYAFRRDYQRRKDREARMNDPDYVEHKRRVKADWRARKRAEDPEYFSAARVAERKAVTVTAPIPSPIDGTAPRLRADPFRRWLYAYEALTGMSHAELAGYLGIGERHVRRVFAEESKNVWLDIVSRALTNATRIVTIDGRPIVTLDDLYGEGDE